MQATAVRPQVASISSLLEQVVDAGLMRPRRFSYSAQMAGSLAATAAGWAALVAVGDSWWCVAVAAGLGVAMTQVAFLGHDAGHGQILRSRRANRLVGLVAGDLLSGLSFGWWVPKHGAHHANPNTEGRDPDIGDGVIAFTAAQATERRGFSRWAARHQAATFFPLMLLEAVSLHLASVRWLVARPRRWATPLEAVLLLAHVAGYVALVAWVLSPARALAFVAVQQGAFGLYLGAAFAPNHTGMPLLDGSTALGVVERQVLTARDIRGGRLTTFLLGGLDLQIEHHLFPTMPRPNLREAR
ncbi:MAG TPA: acyl-CoA desaturase, partial [Acidimicrobiales bacterium]|nr:acyl-CoA desaturase [Acidimicrobiales bacterium]